MPAWFGREIAENLPGARYVELDGGGHMLPETRSEDILELTTAFLRGET
jgi:pimeloyl-ACP methyl ester carboxylesterase